MLLYPSLVLFSVTHPRPSVTREGEDAVKRWAEPVKATLTSLKAGCFDSTIWPEDLLRWAHPRNLLDTFLIPPRSLLTVP